MGLTASTQSSDISMDIANSILQSANSTCTISCKNVQSGNTVIIEDTTLGDVDFSQTCAVTGSNCVIKTYLDSNLSNILDNMSQQTSASKSGIGFSMGGIGINDQSQKVRQHVRNSVTQLINSACKIEATNVSENNYYYIKGVTMGDFKLVQKGEVTNADCIMDTVAKSVAATSMKSANSQGFNGTTLNAIIMVIVLILIVVVAFFVIKSMKNRGSALQKAAYTGLNAPAPAPAAASPLLESGEGESAAAA